MDKDKDKREFADGFLQLAEAFDKTLSEQLPAIYFEALADLPIEDVKAAMERCIREGRWFPKPVELREHACNACAADMLSAQEAWGVVQAAYYSVGRYREFPVDSIGGTALKAAVDAIGWDQLCNSENPDATRAHFFRVYDGIVQGRVRALVAGQDVPELTCRPSRPGTLQLTPPDRSRTRHISELAGVLGQIGNGGRKTNGEAVDIEARKATLREQARFLAAREAKAE